MEGSDRSAYIELIGVGGGPSNEILDLHFFSLFEPSWATDQWVKIFSILVKILLTYSNFSVEKLTPQGIIPLRVKDLFLELLCKMQNVGFISKIWIHIYFYDSVPFKAYANILRIVCWLPGAGYATLGNTGRRTSIFREISHYLHSDSPDLK